MKKVSLIVLLFLCIFNKQAISQACLSGFKYRVPIALTNTNPGALSFFQVKVVMNTSVPIAASKMRLDGGDIRFTNSAGTLLTYWYDPSTYNTTATEFWVKVDAIPVGGASIYLFYGNASSAAVSSGDATFELFDEFSGVALDYLKWTQCGTSSNITLSSGIGNFNSTATDPAGIIYSTQLFPSDVIVETDVISASNGKAILGMTDNLKNGYTTTMEKTSGIDVMKLSAVVTDTPTCQTLTNVLPVTTAGALSGVWSFKWPSASSQTISWPGGSTTYADATHVLPFTSSKRIVLGSHINAATSTGALAVDWLRVRKLAIDPVSTLGSEQEFPVAPNPQNDGPYCGGETINLSSVVYAGAVYQWTFSGLTISTLPTHTITSSTTANSGTYTLAVSVPGCPAIVATTIVDVSQTSVAGTTSGSTTVCAGTNSGTITVSGITGNVIRWEMANSPSGPWYTISSTSSSITFSNLLQTTYFRPVVKTLSCPEAIGSAAIITVNNSTNGGFVIGGTSVCYGTNSGTLNLVYQTGSVNKWQQSIDNGVTWTDIVTNATSYSFLNLDTTTLFRAEVQNGVCSALFSSYATVTVNPLPVPAFTAATVCQGVPTAFMNTTTIPSGSISNYQWDFGNGSSSISTAPLYVYPASGSFFVGLTALSSAGCTASTSLLVTVNPNPSVAFNAASVCQGSATLFQPVVSVAGGVASYFWDHDNSTTDSTGMHSYTYPLTGMYNVLLVVTANNGCIDSVRNYVEVAAPVSVSFISDSVCLGQPINFVNTSSSSSPSVGYNWNFGNGAVSVLTNPVYTYPAPGVYTVTLQAQVLGSSTGCVSTYIDTVVIYTLPVPNFTLGNVCSIDSAQFINTTSYSGAPSDLSYNWAFGDATNATTIDATHLYTTQGNYNVTLTINTIAGCSVNNTQLITIHPMPVANFAYSDVCYLNNMNFSNTSSVSAGTLSYVWDFGDGTNAAVTAPIHLYSSDGSYNVQLIATTNNNCGDTIIKSVTVHPLPFVDFANSPVCDGQTSTFSETTSIVSGSVVSFSWDLGDGSSATSASTTNTYLAPGTYTVILTATSNLGCVNDTSKPVTVNPVPVPNFTAVDACFLSANSFTNTSVIFGSSPMTYSWLFGDGIGTSGVTSPGYIYSSPGMYAVTLIASSGPGCVDSITKYTEVYSLPVVNAGPDTTISLGTEIMLNGYSPSGATYSWTPMSSLSNPFIPNPIARPNVNTSYTLTMTDVNGCQNSDEVIVNVLNDFNLDIYNVITPDGNGKNDYWTIVNIDFYPEALVQIFNRWGEKIYETKNYLNDWQGTYNQDQLPDGTYYYVISFPDTDFSYKGSITLLRNK
jgi:gliding motility-associated-like protein